MEQLRLFFGLLARPAKGSRAVLLRGNLGVGLAAVLAACAVASLNVWRFWQGTSFDDLVYGPGRSPAVVALLEAVGTARTAVVVYLAERAWAAVLIVSALGPLLVWLLGSSAVLAAATLAAPGPRVGRFFVYAGYATALALLPAGVATLLFEADARSPLAVLSRVLGAALFVWLGFLFYRGIQACFEVRGSRALTILAVAAGLFYLVPLAVIALAIAGIVVAAIVLDLA